MLNSNIISGLVSGNLTPQEQTLLNGLEIVNDSPDNLEIKLAQIDARIDALFAACHRELGITSPTWSTRIRGAFALSLDPSTSPYNKQRHQKVIHEVNELKRTVLDDKLRLQQLEIPQDAKEMSKTKELMRILGVKNIVTQQGREEERKLLYHSLTQDYANYCATLSSKYHYQKHALDDMEKELESFGVNREEISQLKVTILDSIKTIDGWMAGIKAVQEDSFLPQPGIRESIKSLLEMNPKEVSERFEQAKQLLKLYYNLSTSELQTAVLLSRAAEELQSYFLKPENRCLKLQRALNNFILGYGQLKDLTNVELIESQIEKNLMVEALMRGFSDQKIPEEPPGGLPLHISSLCELLELFPKAVALFKGSKEGSNLLPLQQIGFIMDQANIPFACVPTLLNIGVGVMEQMSAVNLASALGDIFDADELCQIKTFQDFVNASYDDQEEFSNALMKMRGIGDGLRIAEGNLAIHVFRRAFKDVKLFCYKVRFSKSWKERGVRVLSLLAMPVAILSMCVLSALLAATGVGIPVGGAFIVLAIGFLVAELSEGFLGLEALSTKISHFLDTYYLETTREAKKNFYQKELARSLKRYFKENEAKINEHILQLEQGFKIKIREGFYDSQIISRHPEAQDDALLLKAKRELLIKQKEKEARAIVYVHKIRDLVSLPSSKNDKAKRADNPILYYSARLIGLGDSKESDVAREMSARILEIEKEGDLINYASNLFLDQGDSNAYERAVAMSRSVYHLPGQVFERWKEALQVAVEQRASGRTRAADVQA